MRDSYPGAKLTIIMVISLLLIFCFINPTFGLDSTDKYISFLKEVLSDSFVTMNMMVDKNTGLPYDIVSSKNLNVVDNKTSPTEIGHWMVSIIIARDIGLISKYKAQSEMIKLLDTLERMPKCKGFLFQWYDAKTGENTCDFIPSIDNLNFDASVIVAMSAFRKSNPLIYKRLDKLLKQKDYKFFCKNNTKQLCWINHGYYKDKNIFSAYDYGHFFTEIGLCLIPIVNQQVPEKVLTSTQVPIKKSEMLAGFYTGVSWDGSLFNALYPYMFMGWQILPEPIKVNLRKHIMFHVNYAERKKIDFWGWSPAWGSRGDEYVAWGVPDLADWGGGYAVEREIINKGYSCKFPEVSPYSAFLVAGVLTAEEKYFKLALDNLIAIKKSGFGYGEYGFYDSLDLQNRKGGKFKVSLDEGMNIIGAYNALQHLQQKEGIEGYFWDYFDEKGFELSKKIFKKISNDKFLNLCSKNKQIIHEFNPNKMVSLDTHSVSKGGWGAGLASCVSKDTFLEKEGIMAWDLKYNIMRDFGGGYIKLYNLQPLNKYNYLVLKVKSANNDNTEGFKVELKEPGVVFPPVLKYYIKDISADKWKKYVIPLESTVSNQKENVVPEELTIVFDSTITGVRKGNIYISDICFYKK